MFVFTLAAMLIAAVSASSHSEAPGTSKGPRTDLADLYAFNAAPADVQRTTIILNANGLARSDGGPNYNPTDTNFVYQIIVDNNGDAVDDITFQFIFGQRFGDASNAQGAGVALSIGGLDVKIPLVVFGVASRSNVVVAPGASKVNLFQPFLNNLEYFRVRVKRGNNNDEPLENGPFLSAFDKSSATTFIRPFENVGTKTFSAVSYDEYVEQFTYTVGNKARYGNGDESTAGVRIPGCDHPAQLFVGPRRESFSIDLGRVFDLVNIPNPVDGAGNEPNVRFNTLDCNSVLTFALDIPTSCLTVPGNDVLGIYASVRELEHVERKSGSYHVAGAQTNRLGNPLINELFIGLPDKDLWSTTDPSEDKQFTHYLNFPTFPTILLGLFGLTAPRVDATARPPKGRFDIVQTLHIGLPGLNLPTRVPAADSSSSSSSSSRKRHSSSSSSSSSSEDSLAPVEADLLRLNTVVAGVFAPKTFPNQDSLGVLQGDLDGFPNGRRLGDDVVDIYLRVSNGQLCSTAFRQFLIAGAAALPQLAPTSAALEANCDFFVGTGGPAVGQFAAPLFDRAPIGAGDGNGAAGGFGGFLTEFPHLNPPIPGDQLIECYEAIISPQRKRTAHEGDSDDIFAQFGGEDIHCGPAVPTGPLFGFLAALTPPSCTEEY